MCNNQRTLELLNTTSVARKINSNKTLYQRERRAVVAGIENLSSGRSIGMSSSILLADGPRLLRSTAGTDLQMCFYFNSYIKGT